MDYIIFKNIFNSTIFESSKKDLLEKVARYPNRYIGLFRPTKPKEFYICFQITLEQKTKRYIEL